MKARRRKTRGGILLVALVLVLVFFGVLAGMQTLIVVQASLVTKALSVEHVRAEQRHRVGLALREAAQASLEEGGAGFERSRFVSLLEGLGCSLESVEGMELGAGVAAFSWLPMLERVSRPLHKGGLSVAQAYPSLGFLGCGPLDLGESTECRVRLKGSAGEVSLETLRFEQRSVGVPLCSKAICLYELPSEIGLQAEAGGDVEGGFGFRRARAEAGGSELMVAQALPYHFRSRLSLAQTYARLFSNEAVSRLLAAAGPERFLCLKQGRMTGGGLVSAGAEGEAVLDVSAAVGTGIWVLAAQDGQAELRLEEHMPGMGRGPLVLLVLGQRAAPLRVRVGNCERPVLLIGIHVVLSAGAGASWSGGILLAPGSRLAEGGGILRVSHFSCHLASAPRQGALLADLPAAQDLAALYPRTYYAGVRTLQP